MIQTYDINVSALYGITPVSEAEYIPEAALVASRQGYCPSCKIPMELSMSQYQCAACGITCDDDTERDHDHRENSNGGIRMTTGSGRGRFYNLNGDYAKIQRKSIIDHLLRQAYKYTGPAFPMNVLNAVADRYNAMQKDITEAEYADDGTVLATKKFVRRGNIKDEVLAALIYFEGVRVGIIRKKKDIALFMELLTDGFARGESILRKLQARGTLDIPVGDEPIEGFAGRYLEALGLNYERYAGFIIDLVTASEDHRLAMTSQLSSKIVGAIWFIVVRCKLGIKATILEKAADNTKKNTFMKFCKVIEENYSTFANIFTKHQIPLA